MATGDMRKPQVTGATSRLPSVRTLAQEYGVSHITADKSLSVLKSEGLIVSVRGKGAYVNRQR